MGMAAACVNKWRTSGVLPYGIDLVAISWSEPMFMFVSLMFQAMVMIISLTIRLVYWTFKAMIMVIATIAGAISTSSASRRRKPFHN